MNRELIKTIAEDIIRFKGGVLTLHLDEKYKGFSITICYSNLLKVFNLSTSIEYKGEPVDYTYTKNTPEAIEEYLDWVEATIREYHKKNIAKNMKRYERG